MDSNGLAKRFFHHRDTETQSRTIFSLYFCVSVVNFLTQVRKRHAGILIDRGFLAICGLLFAASICGTIYCCESMSGGMRMPGGWKMSMAWMKMPGQTWMDST